MGQIIWNIIRLYLQQLLSSAQPTIFFVPNLTPADVTERLCHINPGLAAQARVVLDVNKSERHIRGGLATREKYQHRLAICSKGDED
ncbi:MAG: sporulation transcriptional regulator SpoIIID [Lachnospiraceae bacterium]|jgi:hypothetical protein